ncbi:hypothetical protein ACFWM1_02320 [Nocardia sp. NPDC058379]
MSITPDAPKLFVGTTNSDVRALFVEDFTIAVAGIPAARLVWVTAI